MMVWCLNRQQLLKRKFITWILSPINLKISNNAMIILSFLGF